MKPSGFDIDASESIAGVRETRRHLEPYDWFARLWAVAVIAHVVGNPRLGEVVGDPTLLGWATLITGLLAVAVVIRPDVRRLLEAMSIGVLATVWFEAPFVGNHWLLAGVVSVAILVSLRGSGSWVWFSVTGRGIHLAFYVFSGFAKLNTSFFDPTVSCGTHFANQGLTTAGLPAMPPGGALSILVVYLSAAIELAIPVLLVVPRTRNIGVVVGLVFHTLISFDLGQHFYDFTAVLIPLFLLWVKPSLPQPLGAPFSRNLESMLSAVLSIFVVVSVLPLSKVTLSLLTDGVFVLWIPAAIALVVFVIRCLGLPADLQLRPIDAVSWLLVGLVVFNGLTPYLELKTATSWNMYANLHTADGESNHLLVRSTLPLTNAQEDPVTILESSDPGLQQYIGSGYALPERNLLDYLADHPDATVTVVQEGERIELTGADGDRLNPVLDRFGLLRSIDTRDPVRCQAGWLAAG